MSRKIIWEKWVDPMGANPNQELDEFVPEKEYLTDYEKYEQREQQGTSVVARPAAITHFGILPINHYNNPAKAFDFWVGHTNFPIGEKTVEILDKKIPGIEIFDVFSPYRFRISVGKGFTFQEVRGNIEKTLLTDSTHKPKPDLTSIDIDPTLLERVMKKIEELKDLNKYWIIYILPNGELEISIPSDLDTFRRRREILNNTRNLAGGLLLSSEDFGV